MFSVRVDDEIELRLPETIHSEEGLRLVRENLAYLKQWMPWAHEDYSIEDVKDFYRRNLQQFADGNGFNVNVLFQGKIVGQVGYTRIDWANRITELGYWLAQTAQGKGLMTRCCKVFVNHAFDELGLNRVQILCATGNFKSRAIPERLGFQQEGTHRQAEWLHDHYEDLAVYSILREEWHARHIKENTNFVRHQINR